MMYKFLENLMELISGFQIAISPLLIFSAIGAVVYLREPSPQRLIIAILLGLLGLILGIVWAIHIHKKRGTVEFMSRINAPSELDKKEDEDSKINE